MKEQKIIGDQQISWFEEEHTRLDYRVLFEEHPGLREEEEGSVTREEKKKLKALRQERDRRWKKKMETVRQRAFQKGVEAGRKQGAVAARAEIKEEVAALAEVYQQAHHEWKERQKQLEPGVLDLVFTLTESILEIPVENPDIRKKLDRELGRLFQQLDQSTKPVLRVSDSDYGYVHQLKEQADRTGSVRICRSKTCNPGEFELETDHETIVYRFKGMLRDFKDQLTLPSWT